MTVSEGAWNELMMAGGGIDKEEKENYLQGH